MKKLLLILFVIGITLPSFAGLKEKQVIGTWKYKVETEEGVLTGEIMIEKKEGKLVGEVTTDEGEVIAFDKIEITADDKLYMELSTGYEVLEISVSVKDKLFEGTVSSEYGSMPITAEKIE